MPIPYSAPAQMTVGHVHLKVGNLDRALGFYCGVLGLQLMQRFGAEAAFISAGGYHHHIGLNTWHSKNAGPAPINTAGLYHLALLYPTRADLGRVLLQLDQNGIQLDGKADHGVSQAIYLRDPDDNGVELYWDRPVDAWPRTSDGSLAMGNLQLDLDALRMAAG
jgi:catechol 2,3-dioxygenase